ITVCDQPHPWYMTSRGNRGSTEPKRRPSNRFKTRPPRSDGELTTINSPSRLSKIELTAGWRRPSASEYEVKPLRDSLTRPQDDATHVLPWRSSATSQISRSHTRLRSTYESNRSRAFDARMLTPAVDAT